MDGILKYVDDCTAYSIQHKNYSQDLGRKLNYTNPMDCQRASLNSLASVWISMMSMMRGPSKTDAKRQARLNAEDTITSLQDREMALQTELRALALTARQAKSASGNSALRTVLLKSKGIRQQLSTFGESFKNRKCLFLSFANAVNYTHTHETS